MHRARVGGGSALLVVYQQVVTASLALRLLCSVAAERWAVTAVAREAGPLRFRLAWWASAALLVLSVGFKHDRQRKAVLETLRQRPRRAAPPPDRAALPLSPLFASLTEQEARQARPRCFTPHAPSRTPSRAAPAAHDPSPPRHPHQHPTASSPHLLPPSHGGPAPSAPPPPSPPSSPHLLRPAPAPTGGPTSPARRRPPSRRTSSASSTNSSSARRPLLPRVSTSVGSRRERRCTRTW